MRNAAIILGAIGAMAVGVWTFGQNPGMGGGGNPGLVGGAPFTGGVLTEDLDLDGNNLICDADGDTQLRFGTDDNIVHRIAGANVHTETAATFTIGTEVLFSEAPGAHAASPTIALGDGDSGFYEPGDDTLLMSVLGGSGAWKITDSGFYSNFSGGPRLYDNPTNDTPAMTMQADSDTGWGESGDDTLNAYAGGVKFFAATEAASAVTLAITPDGSDGFSFTTSGVAGSVAGSPAILNEEAANNNPTLIPYGSASTTGVGGTSTSLSMVVNGVEMVRYTEADTEADAEFMGHVTLPLENDATNPSLNFGDEDSGMFQPAADTIALSSGGVESLRLKATGAAITTVRIPLPQADCGATCTTGDFCYDTGGGTDELCFCQTTDTWYCADLHAGQTD